MKENNALTEKEIFLIIDAIKRMMKQNQTTLDMYVNWLNEANSEEDRRFLKEQINEFESKELSFRKIYTSLMYDIFKIGQQKLYPTI